MTPEDQNEWLDHCEDLANSYLCDTEDDDAGLPTLELKIPIHINEPF